MVVVVEDSVLVDAAVVLVVVETEAVVLGDGSTDGAADDLGKTMRPGIASDPKAKGKIASV